MQELNDASCFDDPDVGKTLHASNGRLGYVTDRGFMEATNFVIHVEDFVYSETFKIKGKITIANGIFSWKIID